MWTRSIIKQFLASVWSLSGILKSCQDFRHWWPPVSTSSHLRPYLENPFKLYWGQFWCSKKSNRHTVTWFYISIEFLERSSQDHSNQDSHFFCSNNCIHPFLCCNLPIIYQNSNKTQKKAYFLYLLLWQTNNTLFKTTQELKAPLIHKDIRKQYFLTNNVSIPSQLWEIVLVYLQVENLKQFCQIRHTPKETFKQKAYKSRFHTLKCKCCHFYSFFVLLLYEKQDKTF